MRPVDADEAKRIAREYLTDPYHVISVVAVLDKTPTITPPNEPLTLDELRQMGGKPVWVQTPGIPKYGRWVIVAGVDTEDGQRTLYCQGDYTCRNYGRDWLAYRRPPEGDA